MFTTKKAPNHIFDHLRNHDGAVGDVHMEVVPFLEEQYRYEKQRQPIHPAFEKTYKLDYFSADHMLSYYLDPWGMKPNEEYHIVEHSPEFRHPVIVKRTKH